VTVRPSDALQQQIHGTQIRDQQIHIIVKGLLQHLGSHHNQAIPHLRRGLFSQPPQQLLFLLRAIRQKIPGVKHHDLALGNLAAKLACDLLRPLHRVYNDAGASAVPQGRTQVLLQTVRGKFTNPHRFFRAFIRDALLKNLRSIRPGQQRIAAAVSPGGIASTGLSAEISADQLRSPSGRKGCGEHHHRHAVRAQPGKGPVQIPAHVGVVGVALVNNDHFPGQSEMA